MTDNESQNYTDHIDRMDKIHLEESRKENEFLEEQIDNLEQSILSGILSEEERKYYKNEINSLQNKLNLLL